MKNAMQEFEMTLGAANVRLVEICGNKVPLEEHVLTYGDGKLCSGGREIAHIDLQAEDGLKTAKKAIWCLVDSVKELVKPAKKSQPKKKEREHRATDIVEVISRILATANSKLAGMTAKADSIFTLDEVKMSLDSDVCGLYVHSGTTPIAAVVRGENPEAAIQSIKAAVFDMVDATRAAIERRAGIKADADALREESEKADKAERALKADGEDAALIDRPDEVAKQAVIAAAKKAIVVANHNPFAGIIRQKEFRMSIKVFRFGFVVEAGCKPCVVTRFPKIANNKTIEKMVEFVCNDIKALSASRAAYFERVRQDTDRERRIRRAAELRTAADAQLMAVAAM